MRHHIFVVQLIHSRIGLALVIGVVAVFATWFDAKADESLPSSLPDFPSVIHAHADQLAKIEADKAATSLFVSAIGPALQLDDAARTLEATSLASKLAKELLVS